MKSVSEVAAAFLESEKNKNKKAVPVLVLSKETSHVDVIAHFAHKTDMGVVTLNADTIHEYFDVSPLGTLLTAKFTDKLRESTVMPFILVINHIQRVNRLGASIVRQIAYDMVYEEISWLYPGSSIVFLDYQADAPRPFFLSECKLSVLEL